MVCSKCSAQVPDGASFCGSCGGALAAGVVADGRIRGPSSTPGMLAVGKSPGLALFLSLLIPGVGQFYNGDTKRGLLILGLDVFCWILAAPTGSVSLVGAFGIWIWGMVNAYQVAAGKTAMM